MNMTKNENRDNHPIKLFGMILPSLPGLTIRLGGTFLRFKRDAKKAGKIFRKELEKQGIDKKTAEELTGKYLEGSHVKQYLQSMR